MKCDLWIWRYPNKYASSYRQYAKLLLPKLSVIRITNVSWLPTAQYSMFSNMAFRGGS